jgi:hypothetical protein
MGVEVTLAGAFAANAWATSSWRFPSAIFGSSRMPSRIGLFLMLTARNLERRADHEDYMVIDPVPRRQAEPIVERARIPRSSRNLRRGGVSGKMGAEAGSVM